MIGVRIRFLAAVIRAAALCSRSWGRKLLSSPPLLSSAVGKRSLFAHYTTVKAMNQTADKKR